MAKTKPASPTKSGIKKVEAATRKRRPRNREPHALFGIYIRNVLNAYFEQKPKNQIRVTTDSRNTFAEITHYLTQKLSALAARCAQLDGAGRSRVMPKHVILAIQLMARGELRNFALEDSKNSMDIQLRINAEKAAKAAEAAEAAKAAKAAEADADAGGE